MVMGHSGFKKSFEVFIYGFHMPFFFVLAGMLYDQAVWEKRGFAALARKRWRSYIAPYFVLSGINLVLNGIHEIVKYKEFEEWLKSQVLHTGWIVFANGNGSETPHCTPLWFLPCLFLSCLILYWLLRLRPVGQAVMCLVLFGVNRMFHMMIPGSRTMPWHLDVACVGAVLMLVGYYIKSCGCLRYTQKRPWTMLVFLLAGMWIDKMCGGGGGSCQQYHPVSRGYAAVQRLYDNWHCLPVPKALQYGHWTLFRFLRAVNIDLYGI